MEDEAEDWQDEESLETDPTNDVAACYRQSPRPPVTTTNNNATNNKNANTNVVTDPRGRVLLQRVFGDRKYMLRKALRLQDPQLHGTLDEDRFMAALVSVAPQLSDHDTYLVAELYFPTSTSCVDYNHLLETAFRAED
jgi:hypothetical protein